jgi:hypothetical protein
VLDTRLFTAMVIMAVVTTLMTGPLLSRLKPKRRVRGAAPASGAAEPPDAPDAPDEEDEVRAA